MINFSQNKVDEYAVVVMDEAHFFLADAKFNPFTELILDIVTNIFKYTRRIYLSATPQESMGVIYETEKYCHKRTTIDVWQCKYNPLYNANPEASDLHLGVIAVDEDYAYLQPRFFETTQELQNLILNNSEAKWLIFVRAKEMASELMQKLNLPEGDITYYDADTDKELEQYKRLIENEELAHRVTISTKVLDVGVNIKTENVTLLCLMMTQSRSSKWLGERELNRMRMKRYLCIFTFLQSRNLTNVRAVLRMILQSIKKQMKNTKEGFMLLLSHHYI